MVKIVWKTEDLLSYPEAAVLLGVSRQTIYNYIERGDLYPHAVGRAQFLLREDILRLKAQRERE